jgi:hypothetical protein
MNAKPALLLLAATVLAYGCKSPNPPPPTPKTSAAPVTGSCSVLTANEISAALGVPIDPGKHTLATSDIMCNWSQTGTSGATAQRLVLNFTTLDAYLREKAASGNVVVTPAPGIGDDAFYVSSQFGTSLFVRKGSSAVSFGIHNMRLMQADEWARDKTLGLDAAARL